MPPVNSPVEIVLSSAGRLDYLPSAGSVEPAGASHSATLADAAGDGSLTNQPPMSLSLLGNDDHPRRQAVDRTQAASPSGLAEDRMRRERSSRARGSHEASGNSRWSRREEDSRAAQPDWAPPSYGERVPQRQSLYDWAPANDEVMNDEDGDRWPPPPPPPPPPNPALDGPAESSSSSRRRPLSSSSSRIPELSRGAHTPELRNLALAQALRHHIRSTHEQSAGHEPSDVGDAVSRHGDGSGRTTGHEAEQSRSSRLIRPPSMVNPSERRPRISASDLRAEISAQRQRYIQGSSGTAGASGGSSNPSSSNRPGPFEEAIRYLERLRLCASEEEGLMLAARLIPRQILYSKDRQDLTLQTTTIEPPPESSWLRVGAIFEGSQHASGGPNTITRRLSSNPELELSFPESDSRVNVSLRSTADQNHAMPEAEMEMEGMGREDRWPVKVTIQSIDYETMQLSGEMEAFDVPDRTNPEGKSSITTYLEGEIIDFNRHTLETKSFRSTSRVDGTYWRKLMPFRGTDERQLAQQLLSKRWLSEHISSQWILMRWKERCFITPSDQRLGLTISGFYYISLRRSDGFIEGLYYDPASAPYQHLVLHPTRRTFPSYAFR